MVSGKSLSFLPLLMLDGFSHRKMVDILGIRETMCA